MKTSVSFNHQILPAEKTFLAAVSAAALYGKGVFTSLAVYHSKPFLWEKHWRRLCENSERIGLDLSEFGENSVKHALSDMILLNNLKTGRARLTFYDEAASVIWNYESNHKTSLLITTAEFQKAKDEFRLTLSPYKINSNSPLAGVKSCNYLENLLALEEARKRGFDEAVRVNEKEEMASASTANIFWVKNETVFTPALETGCLRGTTREFLMENFPVREKKAKIDELYEADEIFLTSAGIGARRAFFENDRPTESSIMPKLIELFEFPEN